MTEFRDLLTKSIPHNQFVSIAPISIFTLANSLIHLLKDGELPEDILDNSLFIVKNLIYSKASHPFFDVLVKELTKHIPVKQYYMPVF